jgi:hypothetical protein
MRRIRSLSAQTPAIVVSLLALVFSLGGGAYASTQLAAAHPRAASHAAANAAPAPNITNVTWTALSLVNGWASSNGTYGTGNPEVSIQSGIVYLAGSLNQATAGSFTFATLPTAYRPTHNLYITVYTYGDTSGTLFIGSNGTMEAYSSGTCNTGDTAHCYTSLASVSYPVNS